MNGSGNGAATGKPCAGCVGRADNKNPPGQQPGPQDHNNGYECDGNHGIARSNPAHTGCASSTPGGCVPTAANDFCGSGGGSGCVPSAANDFCGSGGGSGCVPDAANDFCGSGGGSGCVPAVSNNFCTTPGTTVGGGGLTSGGGGEAPLLRGGGPTTGTVAPTGAAPAAGRGLAFTGSDPARLAVFGFLLVAGGLLLAGTAHRRRRTA